MVMIEATSNELDRVKGASTNGSRTRTTPF